MSIQGTRITRRRALGAGAASTALLLGAGSTQAAARRKLDFSDPADLLYAQIKMDGDLADHRQVISLIKGIVYGIFEDGKTLTPMFWAAILSFSRSYKIDATTYKNMSNFVTAYLDLDTQEVLSEWHNPWLARTVPVVNYASTLHTEIKPMRARLRDAKVRIEWQVSGNDVIRSTDAVLVKQNPITPQKWPSASVGPVYYKNQSAQSVARLDELENAALTTVSAVTIGQRHGPWYPWQQMGTRAGRTYRRDVSVKLADLDAVPRDFLQYAEKNHPEFMTAPRVWTGVYKDPETLWAETMPAEVPDKTEK